MSKYHDREVEGRTTFTLPNHSPYNEFKNSLWITIDAYKIKSQKLLARGFTGEPIEKEDRHVRFKLLAPLDIQEMIEHQWSDYDSVASKMAGQFLDLTKAGYETIGGAINGALDAAKGFKFNEATKDPLKQITMAGKNAFGNVYRGKVDAAMTYQNSSRRQYPLNFQFAFHEDAYKEILYPIKLLEIMSCANMNPSDLVDFEPPYIFYVDTEPSHGLLWIRNAALVSIQPTWKAPYVNGFPTNCELQMTFQDIDPLYRNAFEKHFMNTSAYVEITESGQR